MINALKEILEPFVNNVIFITKEVMDILQFHQHLNAGNVKSI
jgi:hypothetical protein